ncbi:sugar-binding transcriptional regulator [Bacillus sp. CGMCC 1.16607]|uniref:sugar-binding transcriptional regulator n=1 Tax=Bacillus sp. CGMCC 1.16607 TaxID=3351842 RepID=UPI0036311A82
MYSLIDIQKKLLPDLLEIMQKRYHILQYIYRMQPVGRRSLAQSLGLTERVLRSEVDFLKDQHLISVKSVGMEVTSIGIDLLEKLDSVMREAAGIDVMEEQLRQRFNIRKVVIVSGDSDESPWIKSELGRACATSMKDFIRGNETIAVTGGTTMAAVAEKLTPDLTRDDLLFVPARGGIGEDVQNQANTICSIMATNTKQKHRVFYVPDQVSDDIYESFMKEPMIKEVLDKIRSASMVLHGIGDAITMAERRKTNPQDLEKMKAERAVGEAFGYYFNEAGEVVHKVLTVGLQLSDLDHIPNVIAVAGGSSKAKAIRAYMQKAPTSTILITDEGAAKRLLVD